MKLSTGGVLESLAWFHGAAGKAPGLVIGAFLEQDSLPVIPDEDASSRDHERFRSDERTHAFHVGLCPIATHGLQDRRAERAPLLEDPRRAPRRLPAPSGRTD